MNEILEVYKIPIVILETLNNLLIALSCWWKKELKMVSRRKILSRSRDELHSDIYYMAEDDDDDVWHSKDKLYRVRLILNI